MMVECVGYWKRCHCLIVDCVVVKAAMLGMD